MDSSKFLRNAILSSKGTKFKTLTELADKAKVNQGNLSSFMKPEGDPKRRENMTFDSAWKILNFLKISLPSVESELPTIHRMGTHAPVEIVQGDDLPRVPIIGEAGAGPEVELFSGHPESTLPVLPGYYRQGMWAVRVTGDSMDPIIRKGAYVGVVPVDDLEDGGIYLVRKPPFGYIVKRVRMDEQGQIVLHSENPEYKPQPVPFEGYEDIIVGHVIWWWQLA